MSSSDLLSQAIDAARAGRRVAARDMLLAVVESDPRSEMAWIWLSGLVDSLEDRIIACENVLTINPANEKVRAYLSQLQRQYDDELAKKHTEEILKLWKQAQASADTGDVESAFHLANQVLDMDEQNEDARLLIANLSAERNQKLPNLEKPLWADTPYKETAPAPKLPARNMADALKAAAQLEQDGKFSEALEVYKVQAAKAKDSRQFDNIYKQIVRIEKLQDEKIRYVSPTLSIMRLTFTWPLTYFLFVLIHVGLNPFAHPELLLWLGLPFVTAGSFMLAVSEIRSRHVIWERLFGEQGDGSQFARIVAAIAGWLLVIFPHILLILNALNRLHNFQIPPEPF